MKYHYFTIPLFATSTIAAEIARRQAQSSAFATYTLPPAWPNGVQDDSSSLESTEPIPCWLGCLNPFADYYYCYVQDTYPDGTPANRTSCDSTICKQDYFNAISACLNCIVANGNERPFGYSSNTSITAAPTGNSGTFPNNPNGLIDKDQANGVLRNITDKCSSIYSSVTGQTTLTASPTTTGPYETSWSSGDTLSLSQWTGLVQYTSGESVWTVPRTTTLYTAAAAATGASGTTSNGASDTASTATASASAPSSGSTGAAERVMTIGILGVSVATVFGILFVGV